MIDTLATHVGFVTIVALSFIALIGILVVDQPESEYATYE